MAGAADPTRASHASGGVALSGEAGCSSTAMEPASPHTRHGPMLRRASACPWRTRASFPRGNTEPGTPGSESRDSAAIQHPGRAPGIPVRAHGRRANHDRRGPGGAALGLRHDMAFRDGRFAGREGGFMQHPPPRLQAIRPGRSPHQAAVVSSDRTTTCTSGAMGGGQAFVQFQDAMVRARSNQVESVSMLSAPDNRPEPIKTGRQLS
jgi:hypothetical protein